MSIVQFFKRFGITTGAAAAAAAKAATLFLVNGVKLDSVTIPTPVGLRLEIPVDDVYRSGDSVCASVTKFSGDNPDVLDGARIVVCIRSRGDGYMTISGGRGVGVVVKQGLQIPVGESAISLAAREMITKAIREVSRDIGLDVVIEVPEGEELAKKTMNEAVGIVNGISILGTTGIEWPISSYEDLHRIASEIKIVRARYSFVVLATGNSTYRYASQIYGVEPVIKVGDSIGFAVSESARSGFSKIVLAIQPSKLLKLSTGMMNTSSRVGDARIEALTHACVVVNLDFDRVRRVSTATSVKEALSIIGSDVPKVLEHVARKALNHLRRLCNAGIGIVVFDDSGNTIVKVEA